MLYRDIEENQSILCHQNTSCQPRDNDGSVSEYWVFPSDSTYTLTPRDGLMYTYQPDDPVSGIVGSILCSNNSNRFHHIWSRIKVLPYVKGPRTRFFPLLGYQRPPHWCPGTSEPLYILFPLWQIRTRRWNDVDHRGMISPEQVSTKVSNLMICTPCTGGTSSVWAVRDS